MKFVFTIAAFLFGSISASSYSQSNHLQNQMQSLITLADRIQTGDYSQILNQIDQRRNELQKLISSHPEHMQSYVDELRYLSTLVESVDQRDEMTTLTMVEVRRDMLSTNIESQNLNLQENADNSTADSNQTNTITPYIANISGCADNQISFKAYNLRFSENGTVEKNDFSEQANLTVVQQVYTFFNVTYKTYDSKCVQRQIAHQCHTVTNATYNQSTCQADQVSSVCTSPQITNSSVLNSTTYDNINGTYFCINNGGNMTAAQEGAEIIKKNGGSTVWIIVGVVVAGLLIGGAVCYCRSKKDVEEEGGEKDSRTIYKTSIKSKNIHKRETKENLVLASAIHPEEEI